MWSVVAAVYLAIAGLSFIPYYLISAFGGMLSGSSNIKILALSILSAILWPVGVGAGLYSKLKG